MSETNNSDPSKSKPADAGVPQHSRGVVFISHEKSDDALAHEIRDHLAAGGFACWMAPDDVRGPIPWPEQIAQAIETCDVMLVIVSAHANGSPHVSREVDLAVEKAKPLLPVRVEDIVPTGSLDYLLRLAQWIDLFPGSIADHATSLQGMVGSMLGERGLVTPAAAPPPAPEPGPLRRRLQSFTLTRHRIPRRGLAAAAGILVVVIATIALIATLQSNDEPTAEGDDDPRSEYLTGLPDGVERISVAGDGTQGDGHSVNPSISNDGRFVAFDSMASNLIDGDSGRIRDVFVHDRDTGETNRISQLTFGQRVEEGNGPSSHPSISANGRYVVYLSAASNLDPDRSQATNLYLHDRETARNRQIAFNQAGMEHHQEPISAEVSDDGTLIAYATYPGGQLPPEGVAATPLDERGTIYEAWVHDATSGTTTMIVSFDLSADGGFAVTHGPKVTPDGAFVWVNGGVGGGTFVFERATGVVTDLGLGVEVDYLVPFPDGNRIAFTSGNALVADDVNEMDDAYVYDRSTGQFRLLAEFGPNWGGRPSSISSDGRYLAIAAPGNAPRIIDTSDGGTAAELSASLGLATLEISGDGQWATFSTSADLVDGDTNGTQDIFIGRLPTLGAGVSEPAGDNEPTAPTSGVGSITRISIASDGTEADDHSVNPSISGDGRYVAFDSLASNLTDDDSGQWRDVFVHDRQTGETTRISRTMGDDGVWEESNGASYHPQISADGRYVAFVSDATNLNAQFPDANGASDVYVHDRNQPGNFSLISQRPDRGQHALNSIDPSMSDDGTVIAYATYDGRVRPSFALPNSESGPYTAWVYDVTVDTTTRLGVFSGNEGGELALPVVARSGKVAIAGQGAEGVFLYSRGDSSVESLPELAAAVSGTPFYSLVPLPDGTGIYFTSASGELVADDLNGEPDIFFYNLEDRRLTMAFERAVVITAVLGAEHLLVAIIPEPDRPALLDLIEATSTNLPLPLPGGDQELKDPQFDVSPDGRWAAFTNAAEIVDSDKNGNQNIFVIQLED